MMLLVLGLGWIGGSYADSPCGCKDRAGVHSERKSQADEIEEKLKSERKSGR
jgi:hypothetical protein